MACCVLTAYCMSRLIKACEFLDLDIIKVQYNDFDDGPDDTTFDDVDGKNQLVTSKVAIEGMTCAACVSSIQQALSGLHGVERVSVSLHLARATVVHRQQVDCSDILTSIEGRGYGAKLGDRSAQQNLELLERNAELKELRRAFTEATLFSSVISGIESLMWFRLSSSMIFVIRIVSAGIAIWIQIFNAKILHSNAWREFPTLTLTMDTLVSLSLMLGLALSLFNVVLFGLREAQVYWSSVSFLTTVVVGGRLLDLILRKQSSTTFARLYELQEKSIKVRLRKRKEQSGMQEQGVDAAALQIGDEIEISSASLIPCDCYVLDGNTSVDQSTMTGESIPVFKRAGDFLMSGTRNLSAPVVAIVYKVKEDSALASLISSVSASTETSTLDTKADLIISKFVSVILVFALLGFCSTLISRMNAGLEISMAINAACERAMAILASACPCALGLAAPSAVLAGLDACHLRGVLVKQGLQTFRSIARLTHIVLDKTGTVTTGQFSVMAVDGSFKEEHLLLICVAERDLADSHPVARALFQWAFSTLNEEDRRRIEQFHASVKPNPAGNGLEVNIQRECSGSSSVVLIGSERFLLHTGIQCKHSPHGSPKLQDRILVHVAVDYHYIGTIRLQDTVRPEAVSVVAHLSQYMNLSMLTGDTESEAQRVSKALGITMVASQSLPASKKSFIRNFQAQSSSNCVAMLGDGLNDAPALAQADVGICLSANLSSQSSLPDSSNSQISDVIFTSPNLCRLPEVLEIARKTVDQSKWNMRWAVAYNTIAVTLAMGIAEPIGLNVDAARAGTMMALSSISVLLWSLWLRFDLSKVSFPPP